MFKVCEFLCRFLFYQLDFKADFENCASRSLQKINDNVWIMRDFSKTSRKLSVIIQLFFFCNLIG